MIGHILTGSPVPLAAQWLAAVLLFGGLLAVIALRSRRGRVVASVAALLGFAGTATAWTFAAVQPGAPPYSLRIVSPAAGLATSSPVVVTVCGVRGDGTTVPATDPAHYLVVFVDGHEVLTVDSWRFAQLLPSGHHTITVQLVTPAHHAFNPSASARVEVDVASGGAGAAPASC